MDGAYLLKMWVLRLTEKSKGRQQAVSSKVHARTLQVEEGGGEAQEAPQAGGEASTSRLNARVPGCSMSQRRIRLRLRVLTHLEGVLARVLLLV